MCIKYPNYGIKTIENNSKLIKKYSQFLSYEVNSWKFWKQRGIEKPEIITNGLLNVRYIDGRKRY